MYDSYFQTCATLLVCRRQGAIDDNRFIWIISSEDEMVCHTLSNLLHSLFEKRTNQLKINIFLETQI
jgi:hypothetical protein